MDELSLYDVLGVEPGADEATIKKAWRAQLRATHPDTTGVASHVQYDLVQRAGQVLLDADRRARYDRARRAPRPDPSPPPAGPYQQPRPRPAPTYQPGPDLEPHDPQPPVVDPLADDDGRAARATRVVLAFAGVLAVAGMVVCVVASPVGAPLVGLYALVLLGVCTWTWRTGGWDLRAFGWANLAGAGLALMVTLAGAPDGADPLRELSRPGTWTVALGVLLVVLGVDVACWRLTARRRALYEWTPKA